MKPVRTIFLVIAGIFMAGLLVSLFVYDPRLRIAGFGLVTFRGLIAREAITAARMVGESRYPYKKA